MKSNLDGIFDWGAMGGGGGGGGADINGIQNLFLYAKNKRTNQKGTLPPPPPIHISLEHACLDGAHF